MKYDESFLNLDYFVFSSHKTATQTIINSLKHHNFICQHCHSLYDKTMRFEPGGFPDFLEQYYLKNQRKLNIITVFREPIERYVSSFFQWYGDGVVRTKQVQSVADTIINKYSIKELQARLINELISQTHVNAGMLESLDQFCSELNIDMSDLHYDTEKQHGLVEMDHCKLFVLRFDTLINENGLERILSEVTGQPVTQINANLSSSKWYYKIYTEFKTSFKIPRNKIIHIYESKRALLDVFYPGEYDGLLNKALEKYG